MKRFALTAVVGLACVLASGNPLMAHCDTMQGPVVVDARKALESGKIDPVLKWVKKDSESEVKAAFEKTIAVRNKDPQVRELADAYFFETLVRLHRAGESAPYTGLKQAAPDPIIQLADKALQSGSSDELVSKVQQHTASAIKEKFSQALEAKKHADDSVEAGRKYVEAYVQYTHLLERVHMSLIAGDRHQGAPEGGKAPAEIEAHSH